MNIERKTHEFDATKKVLGRLASEIAVLLRGKHKPSFVPYLDAGDSVIVKNVAALKVTGRKLTQKVYKHSSGYLGGLKTKGLGEIIKNHPSWVLRKAVERMLPNNKLRKGMLKRLIIK